MCFKNENWCDLTQDEQILMYCEQYEHQINSRDWAICEWQTIYERIDYMQDAFYL